MRSVLLTFLGSLLGLVVGVGFPVGLGLAEAARDVEPSQSAATAYALMLIITAPAGAVLGGLVAHNYARTGRVGIGTPDPIDCPGGETSERGLARSLEVARVKRFEEELSGRPASEQLDARRAFLRGAHGDFEALLTQRWRWIVMACVCGLLIPPVWIVAAVIWYRQHQGEHTMRTRWSQLLQHWGMTDADVWEAWQRGGA